jgi:uncharacterized LabA/DUF88 family protein
MTENEKNKMAVLIDSENVSSKNIEFIMKESIRHGFLTIKRIYGDWTDQRMTSWKKVLPDYAIQPIQQFKNTQGKNSTDSALIIDAMDILYTSEVDGFIIVSSDSDYTKLAVRLRESGKIVVGIGEKKTPKSLVNACNEFRYIEILEKKIEGIKKELTQKNTNSAAGTSEQKDDDDLLQHLIEAYEMIEQESEWKNLSSIANNLKRLDPAFTPSTYGFSRLSHLMESAEYSRIFELRKDPRRRIIKVRKLRDKDKMRTARKPRRPRRNYNNVQKNAAPEKTDVLQQNSVVVLPEETSSDKKWGGIFGLFGNTQKKPDKVD